MTRPAPEDSNTRPDDGEPRSPGGSQTVDRALALVQLVAAQAGQGLRLSELAAASGLDRATTYRLLVSLTNRGFLDQDSVSKRYRLGLEFFALAATASNQIDLGAVARDVLQLLAEQSGDTAMFCVRSGQSLFCVDVEFGDFPVKAVPMDIGSHRPLGAGSASLAILSAMQDYEVEAVLKRSAARLAEFPNQDPDTIRRAVAECRARGYALAPEDPAGRIMGLSVAITSRTGRPLGALTLAGIPERLAPERIAELSGILSGGEATLTDTMLRMPSGERHNARWMNGTAGGRKAKAG
jgi:DNA-binding IclR family transcriptional regulator